MDPIDPQRMYPFTEAARLIPSCRAGKRTHVKTLHRWREAGLIQAVARRRGSLRQQWFVAGSEIIRLAMSDQVPEWNGRTPTERRRAYEAAQARLDEIYGGKKGCRRKGAKAAASA